MESLVLFYLLAAMFSLVLMAVVATTRSLKVIPVVEVISKIRDLIVNRMNR
jgi:hypothetical protein